MSDRGFIGAVRAQRRIAEARALEAGSCDLVVTRDPVEHALRGFRQGSVHRAAVVEFAALASEAGISVGELLRELQRREP